MNERLGLITEGTLTKGLMAHLDATCSVEDIRVGQFVKIQGGKFDFFCLVTDVILGAANQDALADPPDPADDFMHEVLLGTSIFGSIQLQPMLMLGKVPIEDANPDEIGKPLPVRTIPVHFAPVDEASRADFERVFAPPGETSWQVGTPRDMDIPILLDLDRVAERSNGVFGKSGSGKSMLTRVLLCGLIRRGSAVNLIFDMHSEYAWTKSDRVGQLRSLKELFGYRVSVYTLESKRPRPTAHRSDGDIRIGLNEIELEDIALLSDLLNLNETAVETIYMLQGKFNDRWLASLLDMSPSDIKEFCDEVNAHPAAVSALGRKLQKLRRLDFVTSDYVKPGSSPIDHVIRSLAEGQNVVLAFEHENDILPYMLVANVITRRIHERWTADTQQADAEGRERPKPLVITIEEAHKFLSPAAARHTSFGTIARELRKFNVTLLVVDQRPSGIDAEVLSQIGTRFSCQLNDENDVAAVLAGTSGASHLRAVLASLDSQQEAMLIGHAVPMPIVVKVRTIDGAFYEDATAGVRGPVLPNGRRLRDMTSLPDD
jgi:DNA helicase HerA-like ATPase